MSKILLIHNDDQVLHGLQKMLTQSGNELQIAGTLRQGNKILESDPYIDLLIIGESWPDDKLTIFLNGLKGVSRFAYLPLLLVSESLDKKNIKEYCQMGVRDFIIWPATASTLAGKIQKVLKKGKPTALIVDDDEIILDLLANILELERFKVLKATNGKDALALLDEEKVDVIISDILMPEMTGLELLCEAKYRYKHLPVIMITGFSGDYTANDVVAAGADGYFSKPFKNTEMMRELRIVVDKYRREMKKAAGSARQTSDTSE